MITWMKKSVPWTAVHVFHHVPDQHFSLGRGGAVESGNLSPGTQVCPAKAHYILSNVCVSSKFQRCKLMVHIVTCLHYNPGKITKK